MRLVAGDGPLWQGQMNIGIRLTVDPPELVADDATATAGETVTLDVLANDRASGGGALTLLSARVLEGGGSVAVTADDRLAYAAPAEPGTARLGYTARDAGGAEAEGRVTVEIVEAAIPAAPARPAWVAGDVVLVGPSLLWRHSNDATDDEAGRVAHVRDVFRQVGFTGTLHNHAEGGDRFADTLALMPGIVGDYTAETALYVVHCGGSEVTETRPWDGSQQQLFDDGLAGVDAAIPAAADWVGLTISKRLYGGAVDFAYGAEDTAGSGPYNASAVIPFVQETQSDWLEAGAPALDATTSPRRWSRMSLRTERISRPMPSTCCRNGRSGASPRSRGSTRPALPETSPAGRSS